MKRMTVLSVLFVLFFISGNAFGACTGNRIGDQPNELRNFIGGQLACGAEIGGSDRWQEEHRGSSGGVLWERAKGPNDPIDPSHQVGTWNIANRGGTTGNVRDDVVCYSYSGGSQYCFRLYDDAGTFFYCTETDSPVATATFHSNSASQGVCGF